MMPAATAAFVALLAVAHPADPKAADTPLSMFRDGPHPALGYALFALLSEDGS